MKIKQEELLYAEVFAEFIDRYGRQVEDSYRFAHEVGRLIGVAQDAASKPLQDVLMGHLSTCTSRNYLMGTLTPLVPTEIPGPWMELWRGRNRGCWYRIVDTEGSIRIERSYNASLGEEHETWEVVKFL